MNIATTAKVLLLVFALSLHPALSYAAPSIVGDTVDIWSVAQLNGTETLRETILVVDPGVEYTSTIINDIYDLDFGPDSVELRTLNAWFSPWFNSGHPPTSLELRGINVPGEPNLTIGDIDVLFSEGITPEDNAPLNYPDFSADNVTFGDDFLRIETGPYRFEENSSVLVTMTFIPEPSTGLFMFGVCCIALLRGRQRKE